MKDIGEKAAAEVQIIERYRNLTFFPTVKNLLLLNTIFSIYIVFSMEQIVFFSQRKFCPRFFRVCNEACRRTSGCLSTISGTDQKGTWRIDVSKINSQPCIGIWKIFIQIINRIISKKSWVNFSVLPLFYFYNIYKIKKFKKLWCSAIHCNYIFVTSNLM